MKTLGFSCPASPLPAAYISVYPRLLRLQLLVHSQIRIYLCRGPIQVVDIQRRCDIGPRLSYAHPCPGFGVRANFEIRRPVVTRGVLRVWKIWKVLSLRGLIGWGSETRGADLLVIFARIHFKVGESKVGCYRHTGVDIAWMRVGCAFVVNSLGLDANVDDVVLNDPLAVSQTL